LNTLGVILEYYPAYQQRFGEDTVVIEERRRVILGMLLSGLSSYDEEVNSEAFIVLGHQLFGSVRLSLEEKYKIFYLIYKRMLILIHDKELNGLSFFNRAGSLNHIYRFISDYLMEYGRFDIPEIERIAFFPGTFDPFSSSHKGIVQEIRNLGFQVYLALDEFSWSKKTQPRMTRRQIIVMSVADEENVYLFPDDIPINLANDGDMARLHSLFPGKEVYIVVGSDVILNASSYKKEPKPGSIHSYNHIVFRRAQGMDAETTTELEQRIEQAVRNSVQGDLIYLTLPTYLEDISSTRIRENIDCNRDISNLISPLAQNYIYHYGLYLREPQYKPILQAKNMKFDFVTEESSQEVYQLLVNFSQMDDLMDILSEHWQKPNAMLTLLKDSSQEQRIVAFALSYTLETTDMYGVFQNAHVVEWLRKRIFGKIAVLTGIYQLPDIKIKNGEQLLLTETISHYLEQDYGYSIYYGADDEAVESVLQRQGFLPAPLEQKDAVLYLVDMRSPLTLLKNIETTIKEPFNRNERLLAVVEQSHHRLQEIMTALYPGNLVLSIDAGIMHHKMLQKITRANHVPNEPLPVRKLGKNMCVPFGKILRGMVVPNTVTKTLHSEKVYDGAIKQFSIQNFPFYSTLENQVRTIKSFDRPVILVDDLLHKGYRIQGLWPILEQEQVQVDRMVVGILSARGKDLISVRNCPVESAYFLPRLRGWYVESTLYPFIGGDMVARQEETDANLIPSVNFILPYVVPSYMRDVQRDALYYFSLTCLQNVHDILQVLEEEYQKTFGRRLTLGRLGEAIISPRCPDRGNCGQYDKNIAASVYVEDDIQRLVRLESIMAK
ncbi:MAG: nicotinate-nicotinamide nucleotide adenylyltransferase, partial [Peptococcaceae bacterium]